jgi:hypothetical protein
VSAAGNLSLGALSMATGAMALQVASSVRVLEQARNVVARPRERTFTAKSEPTEAHAGSRPGYGPVPTQSPAIAATLDRNRDEHGSARANSWSG